ncbi:isochorismatase family protein [Lactococcus formosensis]|uniref:Isochorismatase family protein n=1 Tax=Lactococcus formosensis TaxID=1281486 RepID=A0A9X4PA22_9LACT|nr:isochorismatase family protein [Lactococcus formosensis]MDG6143034.1 isochorismatase family protein [Lactococcus formosensis]MDG6156327.1 isochorismatase family protein [Lactococcus formosensis]MDG6160510.1 isochorismatase family protein [Lactococcus formosensis]MDG6167141.1 isochorismatase family protein [Lactococcus formosensis]MDG6173409.1 isochorismatase family protein [Lactococcus formosensis]
MSEQLNLEKTALVLIDLQEGIVNRPHLEPYSKEEILAKNDRLLDKFKNTAGLIVFVHVKNYGPEMLTPLTDTNISASGPLPENYSQFVSPLAYDEEVKNKIHVKKHNWGAFYGTDLDVQLRRRGIENIILTGVATTIGCDTTAREAYQHGYNVIAVEDAMTDFNGALHRGIVNGIFTRLGRVRLTEQVLKMIQD